MKIIKGSIHQPYRMLEGTTLTQVGAHGNTILDLVNFTRTDLELTGIGYILPIKTDKGTQSIVLFTSFADVNGDTDLNHFEWWTNHISKLFAGKNRLDEEDLFDIELAYTGVPRFRIEKPEDKFIIYHGNNFCSKIRAKIIRDVGLKKGNYEFVYDHHEEMDKNDKQIVQSALNITYDRTYCY